MNCKIELYSLYLPVHSFEKCVIHVYRVSQNSFIALFFLMLILVKLSMILLALQMHQLKILLRETNISTGNTT